MFHCDALVQRFPCAGVSCSSRLASHQAGILLLSVPTSGFAGGYSLAVGQVGRDRGAFELWFAVFSAAELPRELAGVGRCPALVRLWFCPVGDLRQLLLSLMFCFSKRVCGEGLET